MRAALTISAAAHLVLWVPVIWGGVQPLPAPSTEAIAVEIVSPEVLEQAREAKEPGADRQDSTAEAKESATPAPQQQAQDQQMQQAADAPAQPSRQHDQQQDQEQQPQQASAAPAQAPSAPEAASAPAENAPAAEAPEQAQAEPGDEPTWSSWVDSPLMTASIGFETVPSSAKLSDRVVAAFKARLKECWSPAAGLADGQNLVVVLRVPFAPNGALAGEPTLLAASASANGAALMQTALRALRQCQPFAFLPAAKYKEWKTLDLSFSAAGLSAVPKL